jgi:hypothetical protein
MDVLSVSRTGPGGAEALGTKSEQLPAERFYALWVLLRARRTEFWYASFR